MKLSTTSYRRSAHTDTNPENLQIVKQVIEDLRKEDIIARFAGMSINSERIYFLEPEMNCLQSRTILKSGYQSLLSKIGVPFRLVDKSASYVEIPLVNGSITSICQTSYQGPVMVRLINDEVRAVLSASYTNVNDADIIGLLEEKYLGSISTLAFSCDHMRSAIHFRTREGQASSYGQYTVDMFLYILNSEIGDASVRCGIGISISKQDSERNVTFQLAGDTRTLGRIIHRGEALKRLDKEVEGMFAKAQGNWQVIQHALNAVSNLSLDELNSFEERFLKALKAMPEFEAWKLQYDEMRKTSVINNAFDLIYLMSSIPYKDEYFTSVVEEILFGRIF